MMGSADPSICLSALLAPAAQKMVHNRKLSFAELGSDGHLELPPQATTKTIMNNLSPVFEGGRVPVSQCFRQIRLVPCAQHACACWCAVVGTDGLTVMWL